jgi:hypothetical protein
MSIILIGGIIALLFVCLGAPPVNPSHFDRIEKGMTEDRVVSILGRNRTETWNFHQPEGVRGVPKEYRSDEEYSILVWYNDSSEVVHTEQFRWFYLKANEVPLRYKIRTWLGLTQPFTLSGE